FPHRVQLALTVFLQSRVSFCCLIMKTKPSPGPLEGFTLPSLAFLRLFVFSHLLRDTQVLSRPVQRAAPSTLIEEETDGLGHSSED
ncbi:hypothetical protein GOODEAATRI_032681, partial [Goodea atripinnis]